MEGREESGLRDVLSSVSLNLVFPNFEGRNLKETRAPSSVFCKQLKGEGKLPI